MRQNVEWGGNGLGSLPFQFLEKKSQLRKKMKDIGVTIMFIGEFLRLINFIFF